MERGLSQCPAEMGAVVGRPGQISECGRLSWRTGSRESGRSRDAWRDRSGEVSCQEAISSGAGAVKWVWSEYWAGPTSGGGALPKDRAESWRMGVVRAWELE